MDLFSNSNCLAFKAPEITKTEPTQGPDVPNTYYQLPIVTCQSVYVILVLDEPPGNP